MEASKALELLKPIPEKNWTVGVFSNDIDKCCGIGHLVRLTEHEGDYQNTCFDKPGTIVNDLRKKSKKYLKDTESSAYDIAGVNNSKSDEYQQDTPKKRVIALLEDMIKAGY